PRSLAALIGPWMRRASSRLASARWHRPGRGAARLTTRESAPDEELTPRGAGSVAERAERVVLQAGRRHGEPRGPLLRHVQAVFEPHAEALEVVEAGLVREAHAGGERRFLAVHEMHRLVAVHADAVPRPV